MRNRIEEEKVRKEREQSFNFGPLSNNSTMISDDMLPELHDYPLNLVESFEMLENLLRDVLPKLLCLIKYF